MPIYKILCTHRLFTASLFTCMHMKEKVSKASAKHVGMGFVSSSPWHHLPTNSTSPWPINWIGPIQFRGKSMFNWLQVSVCKQKHVFSAFGCWECHPRWLLQVLLFQKIAAKRGKSQNEAVLPVFVGYALDHLLFTWGILSRQLIYLQRIYYEGVTRCGTCQPQQTQHNCLAENLRVITCFGILHPENLCFSNWSAKACHHYWQNDGRNFKVFYLFYLFFHDSFEF